MRHSSALLLSLLLSCSAFANDSSSSAPPSKPIKQASAKEDGAASSSKEKEGRKSAGKEAKESKESKEAKDAAKEALAADELAAKIADRLAVLRKEKDDAAARTAVRPARTYAIKKVEAPKAKTPEMEANAALVGALASHEAAHWSYLGEGAPLNWGKLSPANAKCDSGERQSPIDIRGGIRVNLDPIAFDYKPSGFNVLDNGHTIQVNVGAGNYITVMGRTYELVQFHFHKPSEERVNGKNFEMVVHLVHKDGDGKLAVVAVLLERGKAQNLIQQVWNNLPLEKNDPQAGLTALDIKQILPSNHDYYTYMGSLTTPPCTEGVLWLVMKDPVEISPEQLAIFNRLYPMNARPIQKSAGRLIKESS